MTQWYLRLLSVSIFSHFLYIDLFRMWLVIVFVSVILMVRRLVSFYTQRRVQVR